MKGKRGHYMGTEIGGVWYRRYREDGFFARGTGECWIENDALYFRRYLTKEPLVIPLAAVKELRLGRWHAGQWAFFKRVVKFVWEKDGLELHGGFVLARNANGVEAIMADLEKRIASARGEGRRISRSGPRVKEPGRPDASAS